MGSVKLYTVLGLVIYFLYMVTYKCHELQETPLKHATENVLHPLSHTHNQLCEYISKGQVILHPYVLQIEGFLDQNIHKSKFFIDYEIESKILTFKIHYYKHIYPLIIKGFQYISLFEKYVYDQSVISYNRGVVLYNTLSSKVTELIK